MSQIVRGNIDPEQIKSIRRQGDSSVIQMAGSGVKTPGDVLIYDANGNAVDGGAPGVGTVTHTGGALTADQPVFGAGAADIKVGTKRGNTDTAQMADSTSNPTSGNVAIFDANGNVKDGGIPVNTSLATGFVSNSGAGLTDQAIPLTGWSVVNGCIINDFCAGGLEFFIPGNASANFRFGVRTLPAGNYTVIATIEISFGGTAPFGNSTMGLVLYDGTKFETAEVLVVNSVNNIFELQVRQSSSVTSGGSIVSGPSQVVGRVVTLKVVDDGTHRTWSYWTNGAFTQQFQEASGAFLTPTKVGVGGVESTGTSFVDGVVRYWYKA